MRGGNRERAQRNLYVLNLPLEATTDQFEELFSRFGLVEHAVILATLDHLARRRGFILMSHPAQARAAIENLNGHQWHNYRIEVSFAIVQRSGTPFSYETVDARSEERPTQVAKSGSTHQPMEHPPTEHAPTHTLHQAQLTSHDSTLLLDGLDTSVVTSSIMLRALTEPFGHIVDLRCTEQRSPHTCAGRALIKYCCSSSAALAQLSLHGLLVGASRIAATVAPQASSVACALSDEASSEFVNTSPFPDAPAPVVGPDSREQKDTTQPLSSFKPTPRHSDVTAYTTGPLDVAQQRDPRSCSTQFDPWQSGNVFDAARGKDSEDSVLVDRHNLLRPIGDERQRSTDATK